MKIGILTLPLHTNYGNILQAYALQKVLQQMGHEVIIINRRFNPPPLKRRLKFLCKNLIEVIIKFKKCPMVMGTDYLLKRKGEKFQTFITKYLNTTQPILSASELKKYSDSFDACIVGSDQVWRAIYVPNIEDFFLRFITNKNTKKIAYAASFGIATPEYTKKQIVSCGKYLNLFKAVSVREEGGRKIIEDFKWNCLKIKTVLDPTMLLPKGTYFKLLENRNTSSPTQNYIFCYILDTNIKIHNIIDKITNTLNVNPFYIIDPIKWSKDNYTMPSIENWISGIKNASFVITDSFHGTVFSILFNKPFAVYINKERGADRFYTLLKNFHLEDRIISRIEEVNPLIEKKINWDLINTQIEKKKEESISFLTEALS